LSLQNSVPDKSAGCGRVLRLPYLEATGMPELQSLSDVSAVHCFCLDLQGETIACVGSKAGSRARLAGKIVSEWDGCPGLRRDRSVGD